MKIKYQFVTGETVEIEVPDNIAEVASTIDRDTENSNRKETRRHNSVEELEKNGTQLLDHRIDVQSIIEQKEIREGLYKALDTLLPRQRELIQKIFFKE
jgi:RNA polymerase sigma-70 factor (ECF subfamily)